MVSSIGAVSELRLSGRFIVTDSTPSSSVDGEVVDAGVACSDVVSCLALGLASPRPAAGRLGYTSKLCRRSTEVELDGGR